MSDPSPLSVSSSIGSSPREAHEHKDAQTKTTGPMDTTEKPTKTSEQVQSSNYRSVSPLSAWVWLTRYVRGSWPGAGDMFGVLAGTLLVALAAVVAAGLVARTGTSSGGHAILNVEGKDAVLMVNNHTNVQVNWKYPYDVEFTMSKFQQTNSIEKMVIEATEMGKMEAYLERSAQIFRKYVKRWSELKHFLFVQEGRLLATEIGMSLLLGHVFADRIPFDLYQALQTVVDCANIHWTDFVNYAFHCWSLATKKQNILVYIETIILESILLPAAPSFVSDMQKSGHIENGHLIDLVEFFYHTMLMHTCVIGSSFANAAQMLDEYPEMKQKILQELALFHVAQGPLDSNSLERLSYLSSFVMELFRFFPLVKHGVAQAKKNFTLNGHFITRGTILITDVDSTLHNGSIWKNAMEFNPDRFYESEFPPEFTMPFWTLQFYPAPLGLLWKYEVEVFIIQLLQTQSTYSIGRQRVHHNSLLFAPHQYDRLRVTDFAT